MVSDYNHPQNSQTLNLWIYESFHSVRWVVVALISLIYVIGLHVVVLILFSHTSLYAHPCFWHRVLKQCSEIVLFFTFCFIYLIQILNKWVHLACCIFLFYNLRNRHFIECIFKAFFHLYYFFFCSYYSFPLSTPFSFT